MKNSRVLLVAGHSVVRLGLRTLLAANTTTVVGTASTLLEAEKLAATLQPELVVFDPSLPDADALKALSRIGQACPRTRIIFLSEREDEEFVEEALLAGASCYLLRESAAADLCLAIVAAQRGREYFSPVLIARLRDPAATVPEPDQLQDLPVAASRIEARLLGMLQQGLLIRQLAQELRADIEALNQGHPGLAGRSKTRRRRFFGGTWRRLARRLLRSRNSPQVVPSAAT